MYNSKWSAANKEKNAAKAARYRERAGKAKLKEQRQRLYFADHSYAKAKIRERHAIRRRASPKWLTLSHKREIRTIYHAATLAEKHTGIQHHVDHVQPLSGKDRCGLHVPWNMQIIPATDNVRKHNKAPELIAGYA